METKNFLSISDLTSKKVGVIVENALNIKKCRPRSTTLQDKTIVLLFEKPSLRTRVSFEVGIRQLGGKSIYLSQDDIGLGTREPVSDVARVLDRWVDGIIARVFSHDNLHILAKHITVPLVNALSDVEHPCQAIGDLLTIKEHKGVLQGLKVAFIGDGNNVASSLALACASVGANFVLASPIKHKLPPIIWEETLKRASLNGSKIEWVELPEQAVHNADVVYTDVWISMGQESESSKRLKTFSNYQVNERLMSKANDNAIFMHDMPAHNGEEISKGMIDHPNSVVFDQAENRLYSQMAILSELFS